MPCRSRCSSWCTWRARTGRVASAERVRAGEAARRQHCYAGWVINPRWLPALLGLVLGCSTSTSTPAPAETTGAEALSPKLRLLSASWPPFVDTDDNPRIAVDVVSTALAKAGYI